MKNKKQILIILILILISSLFCSKNTRKSCRNLKHLAMPNAYTVIIESYALPKSKNRNLSLIEGRKEACREAIIQGENKVIREAVYSLPAKEGNPLPFPQDKKNYKTLLSSAKVISKNYLPDLACKVFISYHSKVSFKLLRKIARKKLLNKKLKSSKQKHSQNK